MSTASLREICAPYRGDEEAVVGRRAIRESARATPTKDLAARAEKVYAACVKALRHAYNARGVVRSGMIVSADLKFCPNDVADEVARRFAARGWTAKHAYHDGHDDYDTMDLLPPADWLDRLL